MSNEKVPHILIEIENGLLEHVYADMPVEIKVLDRDSLDIEDDLLTDWTPGSTTPDDFALMLANAEETQNKRVTERQDWQKQKHDE